MEKSVAFIDLLGFSKMVTQDANEAKNVLYVFYNICFKVIKTDPSVEGNLFSDSLFAHSNDYNARLTYISKIYRNCLNKNRRYSHLGTLFCSREVA